MDTNDVTAVYDNHSAADDAVKDSQKSGFDIRFSPHCWLNRKLM
jgi:hypothetical protein